MSDGEDVRSEARGIRSFSMERRQLVGKAIIDGLIDPVRYDFLNPVATEGGDYNQSGGGGYTQSGGGNHNQGSGGDYNQSASMVDRLDPRVVNLLVDRPDLIQRLVKLQDGQQFG